MCFSALQRAENSSIALPKCTNTTTSKVSVLFSEPKIPQSSTTSTNANTRTAFQCSSASRKFLNRVERMFYVNLKQAVSVLFSEPKIPQSYPQRLPGDTRTRRFSALQRAENSSILEQFGDMTHHPHVSVLFSEPKIPQSTRIDAFTGSSSVSVLFSEPKIPQSRSTYYDEKIDRGFSALQRAENSSIRNDY